MGNVLQYSVHANTAGGEDQARQIIDAIVQSGVSRAVVTYVAKNGEIKTLEINGCRSQRMSSH